ncbi:MAG TPA: xanthine dehydrogenase family protein subunit M [Clostridia bacterium]|nr:xanthine dehydrogenase family protein subunit M [Clostridia bacterium]
MIKELEYHSARDLKEALELAEHFGPRKRFLSGGTDVMVRLKEGLVKEDVIVDLSRVAELRFVREEAGAVHVGAGATHADVSASPVIQQHGRALALAASRIGGPQIRNMGTIGGNVANASPAGDTIPALIVLDAVVCIASRTGTREVPIIDFFRGPGRSVLAADELVTEFHFPSTGSTELTGFAKLGSRQAMTISTANTAFYFRIGDNRHIAEARIAFGSVAPTVVRAHKTEQLFCQLPPVLSWDAIRGAAQMAWKEVAPIDDLRATAVYRKEAVVGLLAEAAYEALASCWNEG